MLNSNEAPPFNERPLNKKKTLLRMKEEGETAIQRHSSIYADWEARTSSVMEKREASPISAYAASRRAKPYTWANVAGRPWSVSVSGGAVQGRALRARRSCQLSRQCARCARVITCSVGKALGSLVGVIPIVTSMVSHRTTLSQLRRI